MRNLILIVIGIVLLLLAGFYGLASSPDYKKILIISLIFDFAALAAFSYLLFVSKGAMRVSVCVLTVFGLVIGIQSIYRLRLLL